MIKESLGERIFEWAVVLILTVITIIIIYPVILVFSNSISDPFAVMANKVTLLPINITFASYDRVFTNPEIFTSYGNTIFYTVLGTFLNILISCIGAYPLSRADLYGKKYITAIIIFTMFFSGGMIPSYFVVRDLALTNTMWALIIPGLISTYNMIIIRTFFQSIPVELQESAFIDGANDIYVFIKLILPLSKPVLAVMVLYYGVGHWNSWFSALIYLNDRSKYPLQLILREILIQNSLAAMASDTLTTDRETIGEGVKYATMVVATLPIACLYPFLQKYFAKGVMIGALKG